VDVFSSFLPMDRRQALAANRSLPDRTQGAVLRTDLCGYTALTSAFVAPLGAQRGGETLFRALAPVFAAQIALIHAYRGSILGFSGDALTCWFDGDSGGRATAAALALQAAIQAWPPLRLPGGGAHVLATKVVVAAGPARRFLVGDPAAGLIDVLAGAPLARLSSGEQLAGPGDVLLDPAVAAACAATGTWRAVGDGGERFLALTTPPPALPPPAPWPTLAPGSFQPDQLRPWLPPALWTRLAADSTFQIELRPAVALFVRFSGIGDDPGTAAQLDAYIRGVQATLVRYGGTLLQLTLGEKGDYFYASFGAPIAHEDDAARAAAAALALRTPPAACSFIREIGIGLAAGAVYAGPYGSTDSQTYAALGDAVNLAARLMQAAGPGRLLANRAVWQATRGRFVWTTLPPLQVKGKTEPLAVYALEQEREWGRAARPAASEMIGRGAELALLATAGAQARAGAGQIVGVSGEAGLGKSRLVATAGDQLRAGGFTVYGGAAHAYGQQTAYLAWQPVWQAFWALEATMPVGACLQELTTQLTAIDPALLPRLPLLGAVLGVALPDTELTAAMEPPLRQEALQSLLIACLQARAASGPVLIVLEDAHWLDPLSHDLVAAVGQAIAHLPVLLLLAYRPAANAPGPAAPVTALPHFREIELAPLAPDAASTLLARRLAAAGRPAPPPAVATALVTRAAGNPFYLEELVSYLLDGNVDLSDPAVLAEGTWPASLQSLLLARIDQLTEAQRTVLKVASIVGRRFPMRQLWGVHPQLGVAEQVADDLLELAAAGLTPLDQVEPEMVHIFRHAITQEVTYGSLPGTVRAQLHEQFAAWLEAGHMAAGTPPPLDLLAYHYGQSANRAKQVEYGRQAGDAAAAAYANEAAVQYYTRVLALLAPDAAARPPVTLALADVLARTGAWDAAATYYAALVAAPGTADGPTWAAAALGLGALRQEQGANAAAIDWLEQARAAYAAAGAAAGESRALAELGWLYQSQGAYDAATTTLHLSIARATAAGDRAAQARALNHLGAVAWRQGAYPTAQARYTESLALRRALGDQPGIAVTLGNLGVVAWTRGEREQAQALYGESLALRRTLGDRPGIAQTLNNLGLLAGDQGQLRTARALYTESLALYRDLGNRAGIGAVLGNLAFVSQECGDRDTAAALYAESLALYRALGAQESIARALENLGLVARERGDLATAQELLDESLALFRELDTQAGIATALDSRGLVARESGELGAARAYYEQSLALKRALGVPRGLAATLSHLAELALAAGDRPTAQALFTESLAVSHTAGERRESVWALVGLAACARTRRAATAARWLGAAAGLLQAQGLAWDPLYRQLADQTAQAVRAALGEAGYAPIYGAGQALPWEEVVAEIGAAPDSVPTLSRI